MQKAERETRRTKINKKDEKEAFKALSSGENIIFEAKEHLRQASETLRLAAGAILNFGKESSRRSSSLEELATPPTISLKRQS